MEQRQARERPIRLVNDDDLPRSRLTVFFPLPLAIPHVPRPERYASLGDGSTA